MRNTQIRLYKFGELDESAKNVALDSERRVMRDIVDNRVREVVAEELVKNGYNKDDIIVEFYRTDEGTLESIAFTHKIEGLTELSEKLNEQLSAKVTGLYTDEAVEQVIKKLKREFLFNGEFWQGGNEGISYSEPWRRFKDISVHGVTGEIIFQAQQFADVFDAERFMCWLIDAIEFAREVIGDPL